MRLLTLTPEAKLYAVAAVVLCSLSCGELASYSRMRFAPSREGVFLPFYVATMILVSAFAMLVLDLPGLAWPSWSIFFLSLPLGIAAGAVAWQSELVVKRHLLRKSLLVPRRQLGTRSHRSVRAVSSPTTYGSRASRREAWSEHPRPKELLSRPDSLAAPQAPSQRYYALALLLLAGVFEEVLFRGVLVDLSLDLQSTPLVVACLTVTVLVFALQHLRLGHGEVLAKLPLGMVTLLITLLTRSIVPAIVAHLFFNLRAWQVTSSSESRGATHW